ncbi:GH92 family glycosyl hydrolase [Arcticibacter eurypsychrophilus]|uniref:GH92 family glycosyl hydrolase n=1 Tax=Arcticibacter eurypsychrophilus TaxID=1434752 RepID=UPI00084D3398|nr:GH92 family glycosyl hydrolase [Arcticibacter eurypsychrophilus]
MYNKKYLLKACLILACIISVPLYAQTLRKQKVKLNKPERLTQYVDPYIGTGYHGHVFLGASVPFGAIQLGPVNLSEGWDWCSGYHYSDSTIVGFSHTHLSGTGIGDLGDIALMPVTGNVKTAKGTLTDPGSGFVSLFSHKEEQVRPGYYSVRLNRYNIKAELTATERVGFHRYTYPKSGDAGIIIDLKQGIGWDAPVETSLVKVNNTTLSGYRYSTGWARDQRVYFTIVFSKPFTSFALYDSTALQQGAKATGKNIYGFVKFATREGEEVQVKVAVSPVSIENARGNMEAELQGWDFNRVAAAANESWNKELSKVLIAADNTARMRTFYTALYHTMIAPSLFNDHNGDYLGTDKKVYRNAPFANLTTYSLWDTYRAAHPLFTILQPEKVNDMINSMLAIYQQQGKLPVWHLMGNETNTMVGNPGIIVVADAYLKGFKGFDAKLAFEAMKNSAMLDERGLATYKKFGYIPADTMVESVARGMEYAIADWSIGQVAKKMGLTDDYAYFNKRGHNYLNYFDKQTNFMRGRVSDTEWRTPFNPFESVHEKNDYTEGNAWQYTWLVPQDPEGLIKLLGGEARFTKKLDSLFVVEGSLGEHASPDISGLIGQYAHGNEPSHHITYLFNYVGQPWKTADKVRFILDHLYTDKSDGLSGNEDVGQMSAWYVFSAMGFYPVNPANGMYVIGSPVVNEATLQVGVGKTFQIIVKNNSAVNKYIQKIVLNGKDYTKSYIRHRDIISGGVMTMEMGSKPSLSWGVKPVDRPFSED